MLRALVRRVVATLGVSAVLGAADWPMYLGNPLHTSYLSLESGIHAGNLTRLRERWRTTVPGGISAAVTVAGGRLFVGDWAGNFYAIDAATGQKIWTQFVGMRSEERRVGKECRSRRS